MCRYVGKEGMYVYVSMCQASHRYIYQVPAGVIKVLGRDVEIYVQRSALNVSEIHVALLFGCASGTTTLMLSDCKLRRKSHI